ncbi:type II toxin-antitoxin system RelE/ParE family toxin [Riemerella columbina]|uniref:type II toxin-antitoxin system RelE/ParE family toxin n=1 Tax=Riemerella columbina TaxID=103810 RepID=UPI00035CF6D4|nr:type II toxin-antitoxin system RelE/ParE family toxin [Riemerella columbina]
MAKRKIIWTEKANIERKEILEYWISRNQSKVYSIKLNRLFVETARRVATHPTIGRPTSIASVRVTIVRSYLMFYEYHSTHIKILTVWDGRRHQSQLSLK